MYYSHLYHHGIKGQKWGVRRFQNADGSLTNAGRSRYSSIVNSYKNTAQPQKNYADQRINNGKQRIFSNKNIKTGAKYVASLAAGGVAYAYLDRHTDKYFIQLAGAFIASAGTSRVLLLFDEEE